MKAFVRLLVTSDAFRRSSVATPTLLARDPENPLRPRPATWGSTRSRSATTLFVSGLMNFAMGGKGDRIYQPPNIWEPVAYVGSNTEKYTRRTRARRCTAGASTRS